jgi:hypothetical protein
MTDLTHPSTQQHAPGVDYYQSPDERVAVILYRSTKAILLGCTLAIFVVSRLFPEPWIYMTALIFAAISCLTWFMPQIYQGAYRVFMALECGDRKRQLEKSYLLGAIAVVAGTFSWSVDISTVEYLVLCWWSGSVVVSFGMLLAWLAVIAQPSKVL